MTAAIAPPSAAQSTAPVIENVRIARDTYRIRLADARLAAHILPGQFVMVRSEPGSSDPLLGRPFALYDIVRDASGQPVAIDLVYIVLGRGTKALAERRPGEHVPIWGPLGNGFGPPPDGPVVFVAGGIGQTPFLALGKWWLGLEHYGSQLIAPRATSATLLYGVRAADLLAGLADFERAGIAMEIATDDGSAGHHGFVTDLLAHHLSRDPKPAKVVGCGPPPMLAKLSRLVAQAQVSCDLSLENHMACGFGACFSCVAPIRQPDGTTDLRRVCVEGPIFPAERVSWESE
jgi:dihydroorotate dehydrogenase electron transfer subunit